MVPKSNYFRVLFLEDCNITTSLVSEVFGKDGIEVVSVRDGVEAIKTLREDSNFNIILMDLGFPKGTPEAVIQEIRRIKDREIPLIVCSGSTDIEKKFSSLQAKHFLKKPYKIEDLLNITKQFATSNQS